ncbi:hypothetical protein DXA97_13915 [Clostridium sp. OF09-36]|uniref:hypothetical protein n=1 Tax=Clostridium sp. OF09-36 TaxID=2292310 RepID=UPI000E4D5BC2|nr:hypothetical protein [Clostridium sp. OF09-36]RHV86282.1 hypothetical protein DXA97_13915 [Clostridium sp. OF09-36]
MGEEVKSAAEMQQEEIDNFEVDAATASSWYKQVSYDDAKLFIRTNLESAARSFIAIGYYLKLIRDGELYREEGHENIWDFAQAEYGISKSTASRYMSMNDRFALDGNSPIVDQKYKDFGKSKLQEMLYLTDEQLEQVTPEMKVQEIRSMRQPKEIPYFEIEGQLDLEKDFPEVIPEGEGAAPVMTGMPAMTQPATIQTTMTLEEMMGGEELGETVATSQQETPSMVLETAAPPSESAAEKQHSGKCLHNPLYDCSMADEDKTIPGTGEDCTHCCCWECPKHGDCRLECYASERRKYQTEDAKTEKELDPEPIEYDRHTLENMIQDAKEAFNLMSEHWINNQPYTYAKYSMMIQAYEMLLQVHDAADPESEEVEQPELPVMKNNDQRKEWLRNYEPWGVWYKDEHIGSTFYKYDFKCGARLIVEAFAIKNYCGNFTHANYHLVGGPEPPKGANGFEKWTRHDEYNHYPDNETELVEFLKYIQKGEK